MTQSEISNEQPNTPRTSVSCPFILRQSSTGLEFLAFRDEVAGNQIHKGAILESEKASDAASRLLANEAAVNIIGHPHDLGKSNGIASQESWQFFLCQTGPLANSWPRKTADGETTNITYFWQPFNAFFEDDWNPAQQKLEQFAPTSDTSVANAILAALENTAIGGSIDPTQIARQIAGKDEKAWSKQMKIIRLEAIKLAKENKASILRKGKIADPDNFKGVYRIGNVTLNDA